MRYFVVGHGPSLTVEQLNMIRGYPSVGLNRINLFYGKTDWRPTIYVKTDHNPRLVDVYNEENILNVGECLEKAYLWEEFKHGDPEKPHRFLPRGMGDNPKVTWVKRCKHHYYYADDHMHNSQYWHLPEICTAYSGISPAMQIAFLNGATEIYLIGCDLGYGRGLKKDHFSDDYSLNPKPLGKWHVKQVLKAHNIAKRSCPIPIYNATDGGELELYERVNLCDAI